MWSNRKKEGAGTQDLEVTVAVETEVENNEKNLAAEGEVIEDTTLFCEKPVEKTFFTKKEDWINAVDSSDIKMLKEQKEIYDAEFFETKALCYVPTVSSAGMEYRFESADLQEVEGKNVLTIYASYSGEKVSNTQCSYGFFVELDKEEVSKVDEMRLEVYERE